jgi:SnoaL-like protein
MTTQEIADKLVGYCRQGQFENAINDLYGENIISVEPDGAPMKEVRGLEAVRQKTEHFNSMVEEFHEMEVSEPLVADNFFSCRITMEATFKEGGRNTLDELCLYQVENGKVIREEFFYTPMAPQG